MKRTLLTLLVIAAATLGASAQKFALIDMEYILKNVPSYEMANEQLNQLSQRWQKEIENRVPCSKEDKNMRMILTMHISLYPHK